MDSTTLDHLWVVTATKTSGVFQYGRHFNGKYKCIHAQKLHMFFYQYTVHYKIHTNCLARHILLICEILGS